MKSDEAVFQAKVMQLAKMNGWLVFHPRKSQTQDGRWLTAISGDAGFPDLVLAHRQRGVIYAELKSDIGKVAEHQKTWLETLHLGGAEAYIWRPRDLDKIAERLSRRQ